MAFFLLCRNTISSDVDNSRVVFGTYRQAEYYMQSNAGLPSSMIASIRAGIIVEHDLRIFSLRHPVKKVIFQLLVMALRAQMTCHILMYVDSVYVCLQLPFG